MTAIVAPNVTNVIAEWRDSPRLRPLRASNAPRTRNQASGGVPSADSAVNAAMPAIDPQMSHA